MIFRFRFRVLQGLLLFGLTGCNPATPPDQVAVAGDNFEITIAELDQVLKQAPGVSKDQVAPARRAILNALIDQKLLAQAAIDAKLDRDVATLQEIEASKRAILARAFAAKLVGNPARPHEEDVQHFYDAHPERYGRRRQVQLLTIAVPLDTPNLAAYKNRFDADGIDAVAEQVKVDAVEAEVRMQTLSSDALPAEKAKALLKLSVGDKIAYRTDRGFVMGQVQAVNSQSLPFEMAKKDIALQLSGERGGAIVAAAVVNMRNQRRIRVITIGLQRSMK